MRQKSIFILAIVTLLCAGPASAAECRSSEAPALKATEYFTVVAANEVVLDESLHFEVVKTSSGREIVRYGYLDGDLFEAVGGLECGCGGGCSGTCETNNNGGSATCSGGCYESGGGGCMSCVFRPTQVE